MVVLRSEYCTTTSEATVQFYGGGDMHWWVHKMYTVVGGHEATKPLNVQFELGINGHPTCCWSCAQGD